jgi:phosphatidylserine/phosphatidylglycerophosphate/cardiolipin synthase-like enzyme
MPLTSARPEQLNAFADAVALAAPHCVRDKPVLRHPGTLSVAGEFLAYASPDSTFAVFKRLIESAQKSILIGIYDFTADYVAELLLAARKRGIKVSLMLDLAPKDSSAQKIFDSLKKAGCECVLAPSCRNAASAHFFQVSHEKVIVIDGEWVMVQSGNFSVASIPLNGDGEAAAGQGFRVGNRDMGVALRSPELATFLTEVLRSDMKLETDAESAPAVAMASGIASALQVASVELFAQPEPPPHLFKSRSFVPQSPVKVLPVLTPDNYMDVIPDLLAGATRSILIEQQYIRSQEQNIDRLCESLATALRNHSGLEIRILLAPPFSASTQDTAQLRRDITGLISRVSSDKVKIAMGSQIRLLNHRFFAHLHNKLIIIDGRRVLVSSQNWSSPAVSENREAGLLIDYPELARYYADIFDLDWQTGIQKLEPAPQPLFAAGEPEVFEAAAKPTSTVVPVPLLPGDFASV